MIRMSRARNTSAVLENFGRHPKKTFLTLSATTGRSLGSQFMTPEGRRAALVFSQEYRLGLEGETTEWLRRPFQPTTSEVDALLTFAYRPNFRARRLE